MYVWCELWMVVGMEECHVFGQSLSPHEGTGALGACKGLGACVLVCVDQHALHGSKGHAACVAGQAGRLCCGGCWAGAHIALGLGCSASAVRAVWSSDTACRHTLVQPHGVCARPDSMLGKVGESASTGIACNHEASVWSLVQ